MKTDWWEELRAYAFSFFFTIVFIVAYVGLLYWSVRVIKWAWA